MGRIHAWSGNNILFHAGTEVPTHRAKCGKGGEPSSKPDEVEILLVEDNPSDAELTLHALRKHNLANRIQHARDGEEALDFIFCRGAFRRAAQRPGFG